MAPELTAAALQQSGARAAMPMTRMLIDTGTTTRTTTTTTTAAAAATANHTKNDDKYTNDDSNNDNGNDHEHNDNNSPRLDGRRPGGQQHLHQARLL